MKVPSPCSTPTPPGAIVTMLRQAQTKRQLVEVFRYFGLRPTKKLGQNFLVDRNLLDFLCRAAEVGPGDAVLDVGSGTGLLTAHLADAAARVVGIEKDRHLYGIASRYLEDKPNVTLICADALASKHALSGELLDGVQAALDAGCDAFRVVSNLPYSVASLIIPNLLEARLPIAVLVVTVQKEVAERFAARPGQSDYGSLSVIAQTHGTVRVLRDVPPDVFWPKPKVVSAILRIDPEPALLASVTDYATFAALVRAAFLHRRKTLLNSLASSHEFGDRGAITSLLEHCGLDATGRAERFTPEQYVALANALAAQET
ncbi:ribosomal RNA small subunit methyltransferase A [bacterium]|nr:ribosomal RNA small subunit methyltransferase A [bacterium]